jgi:DNA-binding transcriptional regulator LsrR (DeoR family)
MSDWEDDLLRVAFEIEEARDELYRLYEERAEVVADALADNVTQTAIAATLGVSRTAVQKMVKP